LIILGEYRYDWEEWEVDLCGVKSKDNS
jgi:hypothetical protein